ncbi:alpha/beta hydrolase family protein [Rhodocaloribacter sp.]
MVWTVVGSLAHAQSPPGKEIAFQSEGLTVRGRFFSAGPDPVATLLLLPGGDFDFTDVLELGRLLSAGDVNVVTFAARGTRGSEGRFTFTNAVDDVAAALSWLRGPGGRAFNVAPDRIAVGGHSLGGGIAMAFAARDSTLRPVVSIAGNDLGAFARRLRSDSALVAGLRARLSQMSGWEGFDIGEPETVIREILDNEAAFGHTENAVSLAHRSILLLAGWDDATAPIETVVLPFYRALKRQPGSEVTIIAYADGHFFRDSRREMASDIRAWLTRRFPGKPR